MLDESGASKSPIPIKGKILNELRQVEILDVNKPGNLIFCAICDKFKLESILTQGIKSKSLRNSKTASYFPGRISLTATDNKPISENDTINTILWPILVPNAGAREEIQDWSNISQYAFVLNPQWISQNITDFEAVGEAFYDDGIVKNFLVGPLAALSIKTSREFNALFDEVHFKKDEMPIEAIQGIIIFQEDPKEADKAVKSIDETIKKIKQAGKLETSIPLSVYNLKGQVISVFK